MDIELNQRELHQYYDKVEGGICLFSTDMKERILFISDGIRELYECETEEGFYARTGGTFRGMVSEEDYVSLDELFVSEAENKKGYRAIRFSFYNKKNELKHLEGAFRHMEVPNYGLVWIMHLVPQEEWNWALKSDDLTGFLSMHELLLLIKKKIESAKDPLAVTDYCTVYFNIANFKEYNRSEGIRAGDRCLEKTAEVIRKVFPDMAFAHVSADGFAGLVETENVFADAEHVCSEMNAYIGNPSVMMKSGICFMEGEGTMEAVRYAFDMAKIACDTIKRDVRKDYAVYTEQIGRSLEMRMYILKNFNRALEEGHIQVYFQPVIRTLSGKVCGLEALARWNDPEMGMISPGTFVPVLEDARLIDRLDQFMIQSVGKILGDQKKNGVPMLPISFNLSRLDFDLMNPVEIVERTVEENDIPRSFMRIEVTESALVHDQFHLMDMLSRLHEIGYQVWLDDFGSAYSSLNVLHNYHFDEMKIDMAFFRNFNTTGKKIIEGIILMAKTLGVHTLAEGVEDEAQAEFLKNVGCEKIQGYCYCRPMPLEDMYRHFKETGMEMETRREETVFDEAGLLNMLSETPTAVVVYDGEYAQILNANHAYMNTLHTVGTTRLAQANHTLRDPNNMTMLRKFKTMIDKMIMAEDEEDRKTSFTYVDRGEYLRLNARLVTGLEGIWIFRVELYNITADHDIQDSRTMDKVLRNILADFQGIYYMNYDQDYVKLLMTMISDLDVGQQLDGIAETIRKYAKRYIYSGDRERFMIFADQERLYAQAARTRRGAAASLFRVKQRNGDYNWCVFNVQIPYKNKEKALLVSVRDVISEYTEGWDEQFSEFAASYGYFLSTKKDVKEEYADDILQAICQQSDLKMYWKDTDRRIRGMTDAFYQYFGFPNDSELIGRTDEEIGWFIDSAQPRRTEDAVLTKGEISRDEYVQCLVGGRPRRFPMTRFPVYHGNKIQGLIGYFRDDADDAKARQARLVDPQTGLLNYEGAMIAGVQFSDNFRAHGEDYVGVLMEVAEYEFLKSSYGEVVGNKLLKKITEIILDESGCTGAVGRIGSCCFVLFRKYQDTEEVYRRLKEIADKVRAIKEIEGYSCTMYLQYSVVWSREVRSIDEMIALMKERLTDAGRNHYGESTYTGDRIVFEREKFDTMPENVVMSDPETHELVYMNESAKKALSLPMDFSCSGKKCYQVLEGMENPCTNCNAAELKRSRFASRFHHCRMMSTDQMVRDTMVTWKGKELRFSMSFNIQDYINMDVEANRVLFQEAEVNDTIAVGMREQDPNIGINKMIKKVGSSLDAARVLLFEPREDGRLRCTYEWNAEGQVPAIDRLKDVSIREVLPFHKQFSVHPVIMIQDWEEWTVASGWDNRNFVLNGADNVISGHMVMSGNTVGYTLMIGANERAFSSGRNLLLTLLRFLAIMLRNRDTIKTLQQSGSKDIMTGAGNRRAFLQKIEDMPDGKTLTFVFGDVNGLKRMNDVEGHLAGDRLLQDASGVMLRRGDAEHVFRMGGDEFLYLAENTDEEHARRLMKDLRRDYDREKISMALGCVTVRTPIENIDEVLMDVDSEMYLDKEKQKQVRRRKTGEEGMAKEKQQF